MDDKRLIMVGRAKEKQPAIAVEEQQLPQLSLKCPRCDSSNTKFCYYNNYSLSQPRHFCKACKRYWTRGGTLRNVPLGGGCRKTKRVVNKKPPTTAITTTTTVTAKDNLPSTNHNTHIVNPIFSDINISPPNYPRLSSNTLLDHLPHPFFSTSAKQGLEFSSGQLLIRGFGGDVIQDMVSPGDYSSDGIGCISASGMIMNSSTTCTAFPSMTSLLSSTIQQQKFNRSVDLQLRDHSSKAVEDCKAFSPLNILHDPRNINNGSGLEAMKESVTVQSQNDINNMPAGLGGWKLDYDNHQMEQVVLSSDPLPANYYLSMSNVTGGNNWHDPSSNTESFVSSLR